METPLLSNFTKTTKTIWRIREEEQRRRTPNLCEIQIDLGIPSQRGDFDW
jgi:hypothetical protein